MSLGVVLIISTYIIAWGWLLGECLAHYMLGDEYTGPL